MFLHSSNQFTEGLLSMAENAESLAASLSSRVMIQLSMTREAQVTIFAACVCELLLKICELGYGIFGSNISVYSYLLKKKLMLYGQSSNSSSFLALVFQRLRFWRVAHDRVLLWSNTPTTNSSVTFSYSEMIFMTLFRSYFQNTSGVKERHETTTNIC